MEKSVTPPERTGRVLGLAAAFFGGLAALGIVDGVFAKLSAPTLAALALFAVGFALLTYRLDRQVRAAVDRAWRWRASSAPGKSPGERPAAPSAARTSARGAAAARARAAG